jgi:hypothetical protein
MQITDIQDGANVNSRVLAMITNAITRYSPDLVVFTGDNVRDQCSRVLLEFRGPVFGTIA